MIGMPLQKPIEYINYYLNIGPYFGSIIRTLFGRLLSGEITNTLNLVDKFKDLCEKTFPDYEVSYPFVWQVDECGGQFGREICVSIDSCVAHGRPPMEQPFIIGNIISADFGLCLEKPSDPSFKKLHLDAAFTVPFKDDIKLFPGLLSPLNVLKNISCLTGPICNANITELVVKGSMNIDPPLGIVSSLTGHGIGYKLHESPRIYNYPVSEEPIWLPENFIFCVEPMYVLGSEKHIAPTYIGQDGWSVMAYDKLISTHFETTFCYFMDRGICKVVDALDLIHRLDVTIKEREDASNKCRNQ